MRWGIIFLMASLAGCATWSNPRYTTDASAARMFKIDDGRCQYAASRGAPGRSVPAPAPAYRTTQVQGQTYDRYGGSTGSYSGTAHSYSGGGLTSGFASGLNIGNALKAHSARDAIYEGCMYSHGWTKQ